MASFSDRLRELRLQKGISQQELADYLKVNKQTISGYERGVRRPSGERAVDILAAMADYFHVDLDYLMGSSDVPFEMKGNALLEQIEKRSAFEASKRTLTIMVKKGYAYEQVKDLFPDLSKNELKRLYDALTALV